MDMQIMQYLGSDGALLNGEVVYSLADDDITVVEAIMPNLADILRAFVQAKLISPDAMVSLDKYIHVCIPLRHHSRPCLSCPIAFYIQPERSVEQFVEKASK